MDKNLQELLIQEILNFIDPLLMSIESSAVRHKIFRQIGWNFDRQLGLSDENLVSSLSHLSTTVETVRSCVDSPPESLEDLLNMLSEVQQTIQAVRNLKNILDNVPELGEAHLKMFSEDLGQWLLSNYLVGHIPVLFSLLNLFTIIELKEVDGKKKIFTDEGKLIWQPTPFYVLDFSAIGKLLREPEALLREKYLPTGAPDTLEKSRAFTDKLFPRIARIFDALGGHGLYGIPSLAGIDFGPVGNELQQGILTLILRPPFKGVNFVVNVAHSPKDHGDLGWVILPRGVFSFEDTFGRYHIQSQLTGTPVGFYVNKDGVFFQGADDAQLSAELSVTKLTDVDTKVAYLLGSTKGTRLEIGQISAKAGFQLSTSERSFFVEVKLNPLKLVVAPGEGDSFLSSLLPEAGFSAAMDLEFGYSTKRGFHFKAGTGFQFVFQSSINIGPLQIQQLLLAIKPNDESLNTVIGATIKAELGPFTAVVENLGLKLQMDFPKNRDGNLGAVDLGVGFKWPNGVGLALDAGAVKGGGYLFIDQEKGEYAGIVNLKIQQINVTGVCIINTKLPNGRPGFAFLLLITAEFMPIQLGYGFTLNGVGGLITINRSMNLEAMRDGIRTNAIDAIMFPDNPIAQAPQIINNLNGFFPLDEGYYSFGLMAIIGWGAPTIIALELGLMIQVPDPIRIAILGVLRVVLPPVSQEGEEGKKKGEVLKLQVNFIGTVDFSEKFITFDASLFDSRLLTFPLAGDMAVRIKWGDQSNFLMTVGGFHPDYTPPPMNLPRLRRISLSLTEANNPKLVLSSYFAITSNTVQFGAGVDFLFKKAGFKIVGYFFLDALFRFNPFLFQVGVRAGLKVKKGNHSLASITLNGKLEGPTPWHVSGKASFKVLGISKKVNFDKTFGQKRQQTLPPVHLLPLLRTTIADDRNWQALIPPHTAMRVNLRKVEEVRSDNPQDEQALRKLIVHPSGALTVRQTLLPLATRLDKLGQQKIADYHTLEFDLYYGTINAANWIKTAIVDDLFAKAQFIEMDDKEKLSSASFQPMPAGYKGQDSTRLQIPLPAEIVREQLAYETYVLKPTGGSDATSDFKKQAPTAMGAADLKRWRRRSFVARTTPGRQNQFLQKSEVALVTSTKDKLKDKAYAVVRVADHQLYDENWAGNEVTAARMLEQIVAAKPEMAEELMVLPAFEID